MRAGLGSRGGGSATAASCSTISPCSSSCSMNIINQRGVGLAKLVQAVKQPESSKLQAQPESSKPQPLYTGLQIGTFVPAMLCACAKTTFTGCGASVSCGPRFLLPGSCCSSCKFDGSALSAGCRRFEPLPVFGRFFAGTCNTHPQSLQCVARPLLPNAPAESMLPLLLESLQAVPVAEPAKKTTRLPNELAKTNEVSILAGVV